MVVVVVFQKRHFLSRDERRTGAVEVAIFSRVDRVLGLLGTALASTGLASCLVTRHVFLGPPSFSTSVLPLVAVGADSTSCAASLRDCLSGSFSPAADSGLLDSKTGFLARAGAGLLATLVLWRVERLTTSAATPPVFSMLSCC